MELYLDGEYAEAIEAWEEELKECEKTLEPARKAMILSNRANGELKLQMVRKALKTTKEALECDPTCVRAMIVQGRAHEQIGDLAKARMAYDAGFTVLQSKDGVGIDVILAEELYTLRSNHVGKTEDEKHKIVERNAADRPNHHSAAITSISNRKPPTPPHGIEKKGEDLEYSLILGDNGDDETITLPKPNLRVTRDMLQGVFAELMRSLGQPASGADAVLAQVRGSLAHASGDDLLDSLIALGYLQVNTGNLDVACEIFNLLLSHRPDLAGAHMGNGSARAMRRQYSGAIQSFSAAIKLDKNNYDAWKRRGQTRAAAGMSKPALGDLLRAQRMLQSQASDGGRLSSQQVQQYEEERGDIAYQLGLVYHQTRDYRAALDRFAEARRSGVESAHLFNFLGMCEGQLGNIAASLEHHKSSLALNPHFKECAINLAQILKERGEYEESEAAFARAIELYSQDADNDGNGISGFSVDDGVNISPDGMNSGKGRAKKTGSLAVTHKYRGMLRYSRGSRKAAIQDFARALQLMEQSRGTNVEADMETHAETCTQLALAYQAIGSFSMAVSHFDEAVELYPESHSFFLREAALALQGIVDLPLSFTQGATSCPDVATSSHVKSGTCKKCGPSAYLVETGARVPRSSGKQKEADKGKCTMAPIASAALPTEVALRLVRSTHQAGSLIFLKSPGFIHNSVQRRQFGLAMLYLSTKLRGEALQYAKSVDDDSSNSFSSAGDWRSFYDMAVRWRQLSEPGDSVWWIDGMPSKAFEDGFGLQTPIVNGQLKTVRYYCYFDLAFALFKRIMVGTGYYDAAGEATERVSHLSAAQTKQVQEASTLDHAYSVVGSDFYVVVPCTLTQPNPSLAEGTRLTLVKSDSPLGFEFTIRTPSTPTRWARFDKEMMARYAAVVRAVAAVIDRDSGEKKNKEEGVLLTALELFYYFVIFAPLSRGTAATAYAVLYSVLATIGVTPDTAKGGGVPSGKQLDWEAILAPSLSAFLDTTFPWFSAFLVPAPFITTGLPTECECCKAADTDANDPWSAWTRAELGGAEEGWGWAGLHAKDASQVLTGQHMLQLLNLEVPECE